MRRLILLTLLAALLALWLTRPRLDGAEVLAGLIADVSHGELVFDASGCASCHMVQNAAPNAAPNAQDEARLVLAGGQSFASPFGSFIAPNISPDPVHGIGGWSALDLYNAMHNGTSPTGQHYYPAFPYGSYRRATAQDIVDLHAYLMTLPHSAQPSSPHELAFPFNIRAGNGLWKFLYLNDDWVLQGELDAETKRGRYLVEALGHCGECHTPRNLLGGLKRDYWLAGGPDPSGKGSFPNITPAKLDWSEVDLAFYLATGFTPDFDVAGGHMALVISNLARLPESDRTAIVRYLKQVPAQP